MTDSDALPFRANVLWRWWRSRVVATVDHVAIVEKVDGEAGWTPRYLLMTLMAAGIAVLGLLLSSPAVVIGAMLLSPLMGPIIGFGFSLALFDFREMRDSLAALALGALIAVLFTALIVLVSPIQTVTAEIAARTRPNLFDLIVAILSAIAGAYAMIRGRDGTIVGVAIATALMPPLATVGFGLATRNWTVFGGALLLFFTNFMAISLTASVMARLYGFGSALSPKQTRLQATLVIATFLALAIPLGLTLRQIGWEALAARQTRDAIADQFARGAQIDTVEIDHGSERLAVHAVVFTPRYNAAAEGAVATALARTLGRPVDVTLDQVLTGQGTAEAERAQLNAARERQQAQEADVGALIDRLALVAGVTPDAVTIDRRNRRAIVTATPLPGANLLTYHALETRAANAMSGWTVQLIPPTSPLPEIRFIDGRPQAEAIALLAWAAARSPVPITLAGTPERTAIVAQALRAEGVRDIRVTDRRGDSVKATWTLP